MKQGKYTKLWLKLTVIAMSVAAFILLVYFVMIVSFQNGVQSTDATIRIASYIANRIFEHPTAEQIEAVGLMLRYGAHLALFFTVGIVTSFLSMVVCRRYFRIAGIVLSGVICYVLAYYSEYFKQFIEGRHFQMTDVALNWYGSLAGIVCMVASYFLNRLLVKLSS